MKHISEILEVRKVQLDNNKRQLSMFTRSSEKGSGEWSAFNAVRGDSGGGYSVRIPKKPIVISGPQHILRIVYPIRRLRTT